jgi:poly-gamma-glutamate capsule biosynthesis protein CapA/YwtB (metallophosphatase superfamily)
MKHLHSFLVSALIISVQPVFSQDTTRVSLLFLGDIMQHDSQLAAALNSTTGKYEYTECFKLLKPYFQSVDLTIGNLEVTLGGKPFKGYPQFSAPDELAVTLKEVGVDVLVTANNHSVDRRKKGLERTIRVLDSLGIQHTGTFRDSSERNSLYPLILYKNGFRLALLNYTYGTNGIPVTRPNIVNLMDTAVIRKDLLKAQSLNPDATIVFMHWGDEYQSQPNRIQKQLAALCFKFGATLVIGAHPHVLQPMELNKADNQLVVYSLGNFVSGQRPRYRDGGAMLKVELKKVVSDAGSFTYIDSADYMLQWVYKKPGAKPTFHILPVPTIEHQPARYIRDEVSLQAYKTFLDDSRKLLNRYNKGIAELTKTPPDSVFRYKVLVAAGPAEQIEQPEEIFFTYGLERTSDAADRLRFYTGSFSNREEAERYRQRIAASWPESKVITFVNNNPVED